ncbi:MAG: 3-isopropylmalate dehydratase small subunit [Candidatus Rokubacteria bacterium]|nr:3-isopropylmalate dehydratase small subunit [Candidatus Rokubacteria bacterium]
MNLYGKAWKYGDNVDTDQIIPARYLVTSDPSELGKHCMEDADPEFAKKVRIGDVLVGLRNFGCGSSREHAPISIRAAGVSAVIAKSFARIFYRNSINLGLPLFECPEAAERIEQGDDLELNPVTGEIKNLTRGESYQAQPLPEFARAIMAAGGLMNYVAKKQGLGKSMDPTASNYDTRQD